MEIVDYAYPCMMAERYLKALHEAMLNHDYDAAVEAGMKAMVEVKLTVNAVKDEKEKQVQTQRCNP